MLYTLTMDRYVKYFERVFEIPNEGTPTITNEDLKELYRWRRRTGQSLRKLHHLGEFMRFWRAQEPDHYQFECLASDIRFAARRVEGCDDAFKAMVPNIISMAQIFESRRSLEESLNIKRLPIIAMLFIPLSYVAALFSMTDHYAPGGNDFWVYIVVALPVLFLVFVAARWPQISRHVVLVCAGLKTWASGSNYA
ncbi:hypothetical protein GGR56DRAFT_433007 [Xylariaceae sp. FL0804]|nr:hypothetical protein GGR56DRAFT_433007 [Xylariaceae sp. FL0804]